MLMDADRMWEIVDRGDPRFDGWIFVGVTSTGIYCRPSCPARTPKRENMRFYSTAAACQAAGFRACKRCRPDAAPGSPDWDRRADLVGRAMRLIVDGVVDREGVTGLASRLGYTERHVYRQLVAVTGVGPLALARAQRAQTVRTLLETTDVSITTAAFAAGFKSVRQFNATVQEVFAMTPRELRARARGRSGKSHELDNGAVVLRLPFRAPLDADGLIAFLVRRAVPGVEAIVDGDYVRSLRLPHGHGTVALTPADGHVRARFQLDDLRDLGAAMQRSRALLDLDSDPQAVDEVLGADPIMAPLVAARPGRRVPGHVDGHELAIRAVLGQQVSVAGACTVGGRLVAAHGERLAHPVGAVTHVYPSPEALAAVDPATMGMPRARSRALLAVSTAVAAGEITIDAGADREETTRRLGALPGVGPWTTSYVAMRALRDPDAFLPTDLGVRHALTALGRDEAPDDLAEAWRPYRAYAVQHLWASLASPADRTSAAAVAA